MRFEMWDIAPHCGTFEGMLRGRRGEVNDSPRYRVGARGGRRGRP